MAAEQTAVKGVGSQLRPDRWGDYSSMSVDPTDDCTFWFTSQHPDKSPPYPEAFQAIAVVMSQELKLPIPRVSLYLYPHRDAFERGLVTERQFEPELARESASVARGVGGPDKILVNEGALLHVRA